MTVGDRIRWWIAGAAIIGVLLWILRESLAPFLFGAAIAYFLDPAVDWLEARRIRRSFGAALAMAMVLVAAAIALLLLLPILIEQAISLIDQVPEWIERLRVRFAEIARSGAAGVVGGAVLTDLLESLREPGLQAGAQALKGALAGGIAAADFLSFAVITPVVALYMLVDWDRIVAHVDRLIPRDQVETVRRLAREVDGVLAAFARGQVLVCLCLAAFYSLALLSAGLDHAVAIGVVSGLVSFVPYVGTAVGFVLSVGVALFQFWPEATTDHAGGRSLRGWPVAGILRADTAACWPPGGAASGLAPVRAVGGREPVRVFRASRGGSGCRRDRCPGSIWRGALSGRAVLPGRPRDGRWSGSGRQTEATGLAVAGAVWRGARIEFAAIRIW